jgi:hypothetical protein
MQRFVVEPGVTARPEATVAVRVIRVRQVTMVGMQQQSCW